MGGIMIVQIAPRGNEPRSYAAWKVLLFEQAPTESRSTARCYIRQPNRAAFCLEVDRHIAELQPPPRIARLESGDQYPRS